MGSSSCKASCEDLSKQLDDVSPPLTDDSDDAGDHSGEEEEGDSESGEGDDLLDGEEEEEEDEEDSDCENMWIWCGLNCNRVKVCSALTVGYNSAYISSRYSPKIVTVALWHHVAVRNGAVTMQRDILSGRQYSERTPVSFGVNAS